MASDFTVAWQYSQREQLVCLLRIKLRAKLPNFGELDSGTLRTPVVHFDEVRRDQEPGPVETVCAVNHDDLGSML
jgi:hypothetical protein